MILNFACADTQALFIAGRSARFANIKKVATRKLQQLESAVTLEFLGSPPGNCLEALAGDRVGQHGVRINRQWRVCFAWTGKGPSNVEIVDYH